VPRETAAEKAHRLKLENRRARRALRRQNERETQAEVDHIDAASDGEDGEVDQRVLGRKQQSIAASAAPKAVATTRAQLLEAFELMGGVPELVKWGRKNPTEFYRIWARLLPKDAPEPDSGKMPLETLLAKLAERSEQPIDQAAREIGAEALAAARDEVSVEDAVAAFRAGETVQ
jgi:hypothetical protein